MTAPRHEINDKPGQYEYWLFVRAKAIERQSAVVELAQVYAALGVLTVEDALRKIGELKAERDGG